MITTTHPKNNVFLMCHYYLNKYSIIRQHHDELCFHLKKYIFANFLIGSDHLRKFSNNIKYLSTAKNLI
jgi:hypothetical protein